MFKFSLKQKLHSFTMTSVLHMYLMYLTKKVFFHRKNFCYRHKSQMLNVGTFYPLSYCKESP